MEHKLNGVSQIYVQNDTKCSEARLGFWLSIIVHRTKTGKACKKAEWTKCDRGCGCLPEGLLCDVQAILEQMYSPTLFGKPKTKLLLRFLPQRRQ
jgi:hypothetical protein